MRIAWVALGCVLAAGCRGPGPEVAVLDRPAPLQLPSAAGLSVRQAAETLALDFAERPGVPADQQGLIRALRLVYEGRPEEAEAVFEGLLLESDDPEIERLAASALLALLEARQAWPEIVARARRDREFVERADLGPLDLVFAEAFERAPPETARFDGDPPAVLPTRSTRWGTPVVTATANGREVSLWLDTGASLSVLSSEVATEIGVEPLGSRSGLGATSNRRAVEAWPAILDELRLGSLVLRHHPVAIVDADDLELEVLGLPVVRIQGVVGWPLFRRVAAEIDLAGGSILLYPPLPAPRAERNLFWLGYPIVLAQSERLEPLLLGLDTGAAGSSLKDHGLARLGRWAEPAPWGPRLGAGGGEPARRRLRDLTLLVDRLRMRFAEVGVYDRGAEGAVLVEPDGKLGSDLLRQGRLEIDLANGSLRWRP